MYMNVHTSVFAFGTWCGSPPVPDHPCWSKDLLSAEWEKTTESKMFYNRLNMNGHPRWVIMLIMSPWPDVQPPWGFPDHKPQWLSRSPFSDRTPSDWSPAQHILHLNVTQPSNNATIHMNIKEVWWQKGVSQMLFVRLALVVWPMEVS